MSVSGCNGHYEFVLRAGAKARPYDRTVGRAKTVTTLLAVALTEAKQLTFVRVRLRFCCYYFIPKIRGNPNITSIIQIVYTGKYFEIVNSTSLITVFLKFTLYKSIIIKTKLTKIKILEPKTASLFGVIQNVPK